MLKPKDLKRKALASLVESIQRVLWLDCDDHGEFWNKHKEWDCPTDMSDISELLHSYGLKPSAGVIVSTWTCPACNRLTLGPEHPCAHPCEELEP